MRILAVDDDPLMLESLTRVLGRLGHEVVAARDGAGALDVLAKGETNVVITDWEMPGMDGLELCRAIRREDLAGYVYVIMLTAREDPRSRIEGIDAGADSFLSKPPVEEELLVSLKTADRILSLETRDVALFALAKLAESRDPETGAHVDRVQSYTRILARNLSPEVKVREGVDEEFVRLIYQTSPLHDLGKVGIPDHILLKPNKLTPSEQEVMKTHAAVGARTLAAALKRFPHARFLQMARDIAATHHEKFDGTGYPAGLAGRKIPLCGRVVALADVYDALTSSRVYKTAMSHDEARAILLAQRGTHFDPDVVDAFLGGERQILESRAQLKDELDPCKSMIADTDSCAAAVSAGQIGILVVEDDAFLRERLVVLLRETGEEVLAVAGAAEAMECVARRAPQVILSDWEMPGGDGVDLCRRVRERPVACPPHFIMLTAHTQPHLLLEAYRAGVDDFVAKPFNKDELVARVQAGLRMAKLHREFARRNDAFRVMNARLMTMNDRLEKLSVTDELTGLFNRRHAMTVLAEQWALSGRHGRPLTIAVVDVDHFKKVNDACGHAAGDAVLRSVAIILESELRGTDVVCRIGGEEFLIIFGGQTVTEAVTCVERCRAAVERQAHAVPGSTAAVTISAGLATRAPSTTGITELMNRADSSLYEAKAAGRNRVVVPSEDVIEAREATPALPIMDNPVPAHPSPIDMEALRCRCGNDDSFARAVVQRFRGQAPLELGRLRDAVALGKAEDVRRAAHNLKGMAAYLSATQVADVCSQAESLSRGGQADRVAALLPHIEREITFALEWLARDGAKIAA